jgi:hypothetical protein
MNTRSFFLACLVLLPLGASAKVNPTVAARSCLTRAIGNNADASVCFTKDAWNPVGKNFVRQQARKGWTLHAGDESSCCTAKVLWAEVFLKQGERVVDRVFLILKRVDGHLRIASMTERDPRKDK